MLWKNDDIKRGINTSAGRSDDSGMEFATDITESNFIKAVFRENVISNFNKLDNCRISISVLLLGRHNNRQKWRILHSLPGACPDQLQRNPNLKLSHNNINLN